jgi:hypothetical protein
VQAQVRERERELVGEVLVGERADGLTLWLLTRLLSRTPRTAQGVFALNSHNLGELPGTAVYATGSKLSHCCVRANAVYHFDADTGLGEHRATRAILPVRATVHACAIYACRASTIKR